MVPYVGSPGAGDPKNAWPARELPSRKACEGGRNFEGRGLPRHLQRMKYRFMKVTPIRPPFRYCDKARMACRKRGNMAKFRSAQKNRPSGGLDWVGTRI